MHDVITTFVDTLNTNTNQNSFLLTFDKKIKEIVMELTLELKGRTRINS